MLGDAPSRAAKVLIVEDNALNLKLLKDLLEYHGYYVVATGSGEAALRIAEEEQPDLILMDIQLPDFSGIDATRQLKANLKTQRIPIIAVTAFAMSGDRAKIMESGCDDYVAKPFSVLELLALIEKYTTARPE
jgi:two-component system cell cycle response regulator DivK